MVSSKHAEVFTINYEWANQRNIKNLTEILRYSGYTVEEVEKPLNKSKLKKGDTLLVGNAWGNFDDSEIEAVRNFVSEGGSLFVLGTVSTWKDYWQEQINIEKEKHNKGERSIFEGEPLNNGESSLIKGQNTEDFSTYPMNKLVKPYEMVFLPDQISWLE